MGKKRTRVRPHRRRPGVRLPMRKRSGSNLRYKLKGSDKADKFDIQEHLPKPGDDVTTSTPKLASECGMNERLGFKASLRACSARLRSEPDYIQENLSKPDDEVTLPPHLNSDHDQVFDSSTSTGKL